MNTSCEFLPNKPRKNGYVYIKRGGVTYPAHRYIYEQRGGEIPEGYHLHHKCETPACVNPGHMEPVRPGEHNTRHKRGVTAEQIERMIALAEDPTRSLRSIARELGVSNSQVYHEFQRLDIKRGQPRYRLLECQHGHSLTGDNVLIIGKVRLCRTCHNQRQRDYRARKASRV